MSSESTSGPSGAPDLKAIGERLNQNPAMCMLPWVHLHVMPNSTVIPCCVWPYQDTFGDAKTQDVKTIWNSEKYRELRLNMLAGKKSAGCEHCYALENSHFRSMRHQMNELYAKDHKILEKTLPDGSFNEIRLRYIDIRFSNLCNFKCRGCSPALSSSWFEDHQELFQYRSENSKVLSLAADAPDFWRELKAMITDADEIYFGGGEPLITKEHFEVLQLLIDKKKTNIRLSYNTNLSTLTYGQHDLLGMWKQFREVVMGISLDDMEGRAEYFRHGTKWEVLEKNMLKLVSDYPDVTRYVNCTVNVHNVFSLPKMIDWLVDKNIIRPEKFNINLLLDPDEYRLQVLPMDIKQKVTKILSNYQAICMMRKGGWVKVAHDLQNIVRFMHEKDMTGLLDKFRTRTRELDRIRGESFAETYPELASLMEAQ